MKPKTGLAAVKRLVPVPQMRQCMLLYAKGATAAEAAKRSGVLLAAFNLYLERENFAADLRAVVKGLVETEYAPRAFAFLDEVVRDAAMPARVRVDAAKIIIDRAGYIAAAPDTERDSKDLAIMTREELYRFVADAEAKLAAEAKDESPAAGEAPDTGEDESDGATLPDDSPPQSSL